MHLRTYGDGVGAGIARPLFAAMYRRATNGRPYTHRRECGGGDNNPSVTAYAVTACALWVLPLHRGAFKRTAGGGGSLLKNRSGVVDTPLGGQYQCWALKTSLFWRKYSQPE